MKISSTNHQLMKIWGLQGVCILLLTLNPLINLIIEQTNVFSLVIFLVIKVTNYIIWQPSNFFILGVSYFMKMFSLLNKLKYLSASLCKVPILLVFPLVLPFSLPLILFPLSFLKIFKPLCPLYQNLYIKMLQIPLICLLQTWTPCLLLHHLNHLHVYTSNDSPATEGPILRRSTGLVARFSLSTICIFSSRGITNLISISIT